MLSIGIVGLPNVGKSTLFNTLTKKQVAAENYPFCTIEPNVGTVEVPDERLSALAAISQPKKIISALIEFVDIAGLVAGASQGEGLGNQFLAHIRECDAICQVVRDFDNSNIIHVHNQVNPEHDKQVIDLELILADLATVAKRLDKASKDAKSGDKKILTYLELIKQVHTHLESEQPVRTLNLSDEDKLALKDLSLLSAKPMLFVINSDDTSKPCAANELRLNIKLENEIASLPTEEQAEYMEALGVSESGLSKLIRSSYQLLGLESFLPLVPTKLVLGPSLLVPKPPKPPVSFTLISSKASSAPKSSIGKTLLLAVLSLLLAPRAYSELRARIILCKTAISAISSLTKIKSLIIKAF